MIKEIKLENNDIPVRIPVVQDTNAIPIQFQITDYKIPTGAEARIYILKPSGAEIYNSCTISDNSVLVQPTTQMYAEKGTLFGQIQIIKGTTIAASFVLEFVVAENIISDSAIESKDEFGVLDALIVQARSAISDAQTAASAANTAATQATTAADSAGDAAQAANSAAAELQQKVNNGDFTASVTVGTVTTGEPGTAAAVTNSGTSKDAILDFTIPQGDPGNVGDIDDATVTFTQATSRTNLISGDSVKTLFGKIQKWFSDLKAAAFRNVANNRTTASSGISVLDAYQGKLLQDQIDDMWNLIYPIGCIYMTTDPTDPSGLFGGEWELWGSGRVPVGVDETDDDFAVVEQTGGQKTVAQFAWIGATDGDVTKIAYACGVPSGAAVNKVKSLYNGYGNKGTGTGGVTAVNNVTYVTDTDGNSTSVLQPYITCYMWKRIA